MILIISENNETTTTEVIKWLCYYNKPFILIHEDESFTIDMIDHRILLNSDKNKFYLDEIKSVWFRRGSLRFTRLKYENNSVNHYMDEVQYWLEDYVRKSLENKKIINKESDFFVNKLLVLKAAENVGLNVPNYFLSKNTNKVSLGRTIVKPITGNGSLENFTEDFNGMIYTSVVQERENCDFFISFFQVRIEKQYEIRCFYLNGKIWSMAIFSQNDEKTKTDFRRYNRLKPNRCVPYKLPESIENKIKNLMKNLNYTSGSLDFIKSQDHFYFLEINPIGQFGFVSTAGNYSLDKVIAEYL